MNPRYIGKMLFFLLFLLVGFSPLGLRAETVEEIYARTVSQLREEGFMGIDRALTVFEALMERDPDFIMAYLSAADAYLLKYEFSENKDKWWLDRALNYLNAVIENDKDLSVAYFKRAIILFNLGQSNEAENNLKKAMEISPEYLDAHILYLQHLLSADRKEEARNFAESSLKVFPKDPAPLKYFGDIFFQEGAYKDAINFYKRVASLVPQAPYTHMAMGKAYQRQENYDLAIESYQKALVQNPELFEIHFGLSYCYSETGRLEDAIRHLKVYSKKAPKDVSVLNNLALLYEQTGQIQKARLMWLKVKEATKDKTYRERAEQHLYGLLSATEKSKASSKQQPQSPQGRKTNANKDE